MKLRTLSIFLIAALLSWQHTRAEENEVTNLALSATVSTSFCSGWESLAAVNDGKVASVSKDDRAHPVYGNWDGPDNYGATNWVQYEWPFAHQIKEIAVFWFVDGGGGLSKPTESLVEYWFGSEWTSLGSIGTDMDVFNSLNVDVKASKIRLSMKSATSTGISEFQVMGIESASCDAVEISSYIQINDQALQAGNTANLSYGDSVRFVIRPDEAYTGEAYYFWQGPNNLTSSDNELFLNNLQPGMEGVYKATFTNECGSNSSAFFYLTLADVIDGSAYEWPAYSPTVAYDIESEYPNLQMPTKDLNDVSNVAWTYSDRWWTFKAGTKARSVVTMAAAEPMLVKFNEDFAYIRDVMGWPPDKRSREGYRSAVYLYGSGLSCDNADSTALGGWQGSVHYNGSNWAMVLASYYPVYCFDPSCPYTDKGYQTEAMIHEGIHCILADLPGCRNAAWFHEGGNTWLQQEMTVLRAKNPDYSTMGFLNAGAIIAPFMPIECYSGWLQDETFGGPSAEGVNRFEGSQQICTWKNLLGGTQYGNTFPVFLGMTLGYKSVPWIWRYCESRVLEGLAEGLGETQIRRLIMEYRAKQALLDMGLWTPAFRNLLNANFGGSIKSEWSPYWINSPVWKATPYAITTNDGNGLLTPEYRTTPGWSGANLIPLVIKSDSIVVSFQPLSENMTCQLCYRTRKGETVYSKPVFAGDCILRIPADKQPANNVVIAVICNTDYIYEGEKTRTAHHDYRLQMGHGIYGTADVNRKWYDWTLTINAIEQPFAEQLQWNVYPTLVKRGASISIDCGEPLKSSAKLEVLSLGGQKVYQNSLYDKTSSLTLPTSIAPGVYMLAIQYEGGKAVQKIVLE